MPASNSGNRPKWLRPHHPDVAASFRGRPGGVVHNQPDQAVTSLATLPGNNEHHRQFPLRHSYPNLSNQFMAQRPDGVTMNSLGFYGYRKGLPLNGGDKQKGGLTDGPNRHPGFQLRSGQALCSGENHSACRGTRHSFSLVIKTTLLYPEAQCTTSQYRSFSFPGI